MIVKVSDKNAARIYPAVHGGMIHIGKELARLSNPTRKKMNTDVIPLTSIFEMIAQVDTANIRSTVQHLQDYGTRNVYTTQAVEAQNWLYDQFVSFGLDVELFDFSMPGGSASDDVIATKTGTLYPDEYIVLGAHYDSYASPNNAPGADDNATGSAGIIEIARILSQYSFDRTIIFATWSGEEYGLYGSAAWASWAAQNNLNILGYFNIDMSGYLYNNGPIHTDMIAPTSAQDLVDIYTNTCAVYLPGFIIESGGSIGGDSDHTSFNNNGFMGIFPFEDTDHYSPYIHTTNDLIGPSVNSFEMVGEFTKATLASVASMAEMLPVPQNLSGISLDSQVDLSWQGLDGVDYYNIYRDQSIEPYATSTSTDFSDMDVINGTSYSYYVTAVFQNTGDESGPSNIVTVIPMPPISLPFFDDFESNAPYWTLEGSWGLQEGTYYSPDYSLTESPVGNYSPDMHISATLSSLDFSSVAEAQLTFMTKYSLEEDYDYMYLEISTDGLTWEILQSYNGFQTSWEEETFSLDSFVGNPSVKIRFRFSSDTYTEEDGMFIDDFTINTSGVGVYEANLTNMATLNQNRPNPASKNTIISFSLSDDGPVSINLFDQSGKKVRELINTSMHAGNYTYDLNVNELEEGIYYYTLNTRDASSSRKLVVTR